MIVHQRLASAGLGHCPASTTGTARGVNTRGVLFAIFLALALQALPAHAQVRLWDSTGVAVCTAAGWQRAVRMVSDGSDGAIIVWEDLRSGSNAAIYAARIRPDATLPWAMDGVEVAAAAPAQKLASIVADGAGGAVIVWWNDAAGHSDVYAQRIDGNGTRLWSAAGVRVCGASGNQQWAEVVADGTGGFIIAWHDRRGSDNDVYAQRLDAMGAAQWGTDGLAVSTAPGDQSYPQLAVDRQGGVFIVWMDRRVEDDIYMQRVRADGTLAWPADRVVCAEANRQVAPKILPFGDEQVVVFWQDYRLGVSTSALYLQIFSLDGERTYVEDYQVTESDKSQSGMFLAPDGRKGALAVWSDFRKSATNGDIYMRRINADGTVIGDFGNALSDATDTQERPQIIDDGFGGGFAVWQDRRNGFDYDIYMNRVSSQGVTNYAEWNRHSGVLLHKHDNNQLSPQVVASARGTAIVAWYDGRVLDGQADIYAQRVAWAPNLLRPDSLNFPAIKVGTTVTDTIVIANNGARPLLISNIRRASDPGTTQPGDFTYLQNVSLPLTLQPDSTVALHVSFKAGGVGRRISELRISSNAPEDPAIIPLIGRGSNPVLQTESIVVFPTTKQGSGTEIELAGFIRNTGSGPLLVHGVEFGGRDSARFALGAMPPLPWEIAEGTAAPLRLRFEPDVVGPYEGQLRLYHNADSQPRNVRLSGIGGRPTLLTIPLVLYFDTTMATRTQEKEVRIKNTSGVELLVTGLHVSGADSSEFSVQATLPLRIPGEASAPVLVRFAPTGGGPKRADLIITSDATSSPDVLRINAAATPLGLALSSPEQAFAIQDIAPHPLPASGVFRAMLNLEAAQVERVRFHLVDVLGRECALSRMAQHESATVLRLHGIAPGMYLLVATHPTLGRTARSLLLR